MKREFTDQTRGQIQDVFNIPRYENLEELADNMLDAEERRLAAEKADRTPEMGLEDDYVGMGGDGDINAVKVADNMLDADEKRLLVEDVEKTIEMGPEDEYVEMGGDGENNGVIGDGDINVVENNQSEHGGENQLKAQEDKDDIEEHRGEGGKGDDVKGMKRYNCTKIEF